jgi:hypothetical protein
MSQPTFSVTAADRAHQSGGWLAVAIGLDLVTLVLLVFVSHLLPLG